MSARVEPGKTRFGGTVFRWKLLVAMMGVVAGITAIAIYVAQRNLAAEAEESLRREFDEKIRSLHGIQEVRHAVLSERCRTLARKPRIHAALEDNALDLLYPSAQDELRDVLQETNRIAPGVLNALFYRFLDANGKVLPPMDGENPGTLSASEEASLSLGTVPHLQQLGYLRRGSSTNEVVNEVIAVPIFSSETGETIAALALGFEPLQLEGRRGTGALKSGVWLAGRVHFRQLDPAARQTLQTEINQRIERAAQQNHFTVELAGIPHLTFFAPLNPGSAYPRAYEVCLFPLTDLRVRQEQLRWQILSGAGLMLLAGFVASHYFAGKLSLPVERLAVDSETNRLRRELAEATLDVRNAELQRSARFSADASHQLKTPVTVTRAGLEELLAREDLSDDFREEISNLIHQSFRLTSVVDDLLLLARMDSGRMQLNLAPLDLSLLVESELDDLSAQPDAPEIEVQADVAPGISIEGDKRYTTMIVRNLLENARKYNRPKGIIKVRAVFEGEAVRLEIGNTGAGIPAAMRERIFERFHRGVVGENVPGHGLGLNLARELARLHGGELRLVRSGNDWTEFEVRFRAARAEKVGAE